MESPYMDLMFREMNIMICKIGTTAPATGTKEVVIIPFKKLDTIAEDIATTGPSLLDLLA